MLFAHVSHNAVTARPWRRATLSRDTLRLTDVGKLMLAPRHVVGYLRLNPCRSILRNSSQYFGAAPYMAYLLRWPKGFKVQFKRRRNC